MIQASALTRVLGSSDVEGLDLASLLQTETRPNPEVADYPDAKYVNYKSLGISLCYETTPPSTSKSLAFIDLFNPPSSGTRRPRRKQAYDGYACPPLPLVFKFNNTTLDLPPPPAPRQGKKLPDNIPTTMERSLNFEVDDHTTGKDFVSHFGEPTKKGEGQEGYVPPFMEWERVEIVDDEGKTVEVGVMVELQEGGSGGGDDEAKKGAALWDRAGDWTWVGLKLFAVSSSSGL